MRHYLKLGTGIIALPWTSGGTVAVAPPASDAWTAISEASICWAQLSSTTVGIAEVDFTLQVTTQYPLCISDETARALPIYTSTISVP